MLICPDSFKGTLSAEQVSTIIAEAIYEINPAVKTQQLPIADGGEGTLKTLIFATKGKLYSVQVKGPLGEPILAQYGVLGDGETCVIELAQASGLLLVAHEKRNPFKATTFGTGELIAAALNEGYRKFIICLGGSATNDAGFGLLQALGVRFLNAKGEELCESVDQLLQLKDIDLSHFHPAIKESEFVIANDVDNPLIGECGASAVFGPQKGVKTHEVAQFDAYLKQFADVVAQRKKIRLHDLPGAGAAGGVGGTMKAFFSATFKRGIDVVLDTANFEKALQSVQLVITGEGKSDVQTLYGKAPLGVVQCARPFNVPVVLLSGVVEEESKEQLEAVFSAVYAVVGDGISREASIANPEENLKRRILQSMQDLFEK